MSGDRSSQHGAHGQPSNPGEREPAPSNNGRDADRSKWAEKQVFTTGEAAEVCKVSQQTIIRCFDSGRLNGFRVPGSRFRRIPRGELIRFMRSNEIPLDTLGDDRKRVLVVDDDPQVLAIVQETLKDERFDLRTAGNGYDAGILTEQFRPDLILLDFMLPDINGSVVCERIRGNPEYAGTRIVFVSGVVDEADVSRLMARGADAFIQKPFRADELLRTVTKLLEA
ncbi:MAG: response regulator [Phycisphaerae bacterium]|jgi:excisionase family DNA binding protein|nr:response regulator [Phycisphaerae bacterium]